MIESQLPPFLIGQARLCCVTRFAWPVAKAGETGPHKLYPQAKHALLKPAELCRVQACGAVSCAGLSCLHSVSQKPAGRPHVWVCKTIWDGT